MPGKAYKVSDTATAETEASRRQTIYAVLASVLGWSLDLFDLFILLYVAPVIGALFFPFGVLLVPETRGRFE